MHFIRGVLRRRERSRVLTAELSLALVLRFLVTTTESTDCAFHFGVSMSTYSKYLHHGLRVLKETLELFPVSTYHIPDIASQELYADVITELSDGDLKNVWGAVDGITLNFETSSDITIEGDNYNGYKKRAAKKLVCIFAPDGSICGASWAAGVVSDGAIWKLLAAKLELQQRHVDRTPRLRVLGDSAFKHSRVLWQATERNVGDVDIGILRRFRNFSEIGLGGLNRCCRRLLVKLPSDDSDMCDMVIATTLLYTNFRIRIAHEGQLFTMHRAVMSCCSPSSDESDDGDDSDDDDDSDNESD